MGQKLKRARAAARATRKPPKAGPPQETVLHVVVKTDGPVPMKKIIAWFKQTVLEDGAGMPGWQGKYPPWAVIGDRKITNVTVKRDADVQRPRRQ